MAQLYTHNPWLTEHELTCDQLYTINTKNGTYTNLIISCGLLSLRTILDHGSLIFGLAQCKTYEYVNTLQCLNCYKYGHFARECGTPKICKRCSQEHSIETCTETNYKCINCVIANEKGANYNSRHIATDDRCLVRKERIDALKGVALSKN